MIELVIPEATPSLNVLLCQQWWRRHKVRKRWHWLVRAARLQASVFEKPRYLRSTIMIERTGARILDSDNAAGGAKFLVDGLVREGIIAGDSPAHIGTPVIKQHIDKTIRRTVVRIVEAT